MTLPILKEKSRHENRRRIRFIFEMDSSLLKTSLIWSLLPLFCCFIHSVMFSKSNRAKAKTSWMKTITIMGKHLKRLNSVNSFCASLHSILEHGVFSFQKPSMKATFELSTQSNCCFLSSTFIAAVTENSFHTYKLRVYWFCWIICRCLWLSWLNMFNRFSSTEKLLCAFQKAHEYTIVNNPLINIA